MASDFILQNIYRIHQIRYPKRPLFQVKSKKNDTIGSATLIAPEIISGIKPGMYGFLFSAHMRRCCLENLHYCNFDCVRECCHECVRKTCTVDSWGLLSKPLCGCKRQGRDLCQKHQSVAAMGYPWCSCSRPPEICIIRSSKRC